MKYGEGQMVISILVPVKQVGDAWYKWFLSCSVSIGNYTESLVHQPVSAVHQFTCMQEADRVIAWKNVLTYSNTETSIHILNSFTSDSQHSQNCLRVITYHAAKNDFRISIHLQFLKQIHQLFIQRVPRLQVQKYTNGTCADLAKFYIICKCCISGGICIDKTKAHSKH